MKTFILSVVLCLAAHCAFGQNKGNSENPVHVGMEVYVMEERSPEGMLL